MQRKDRWIKVRAHCETAVEHTYGVRYVHAQDLVKKVDDRHYHDGDAKEEVQIDLHTLRDASLRSRLRRKKFEWVYKDSVNCSQRTKAGPLAKLVTTWKSANGWVRFSSISIFHAWRWATTSQLYTIQSVSSESKKK